MDKPTFDKLKALFINCTLKKSPEQSHTEGLMNISMQIMKKNNVEVNYIRLVDHDIAYGIYPDMTEHGWETDEWPELFKQVMDADILVIGSPIWLGERSAVCTKLIERLYASSGEQNEKGQYKYYGKTGGCVITGNEDGVKHCSKGILFALQHIGYTIPPQAESGWVGEAGPGPSYLDEGSGGPENDFTQRTITFMSWNLMHMAHILRQNNGFPVYGNQVSEWENGASYDHPFR